MRLWIPIAGAVAISAIAFAAYRNSAEVVTFTVDDKERTVTGSSENMSSKWLVFTVGGETFEVTDSLTFGDFSASDRYSQLHRGCTYTGTAAGWRVPILSMNRNIVDAEHDGPCMRTIPER